jgi:hypothetical protein
MNIPQSFDRPARSSGRALILATGAALGLGTLAYVAWSAEQRSLAARPRDSAPSRTRRMGLAEGSAASTAVTIMAPPSGVLRAITDYRAEALVEDRPGQVLARELLGDDHALFRPIEHDGDEVVSWRTEDDAWLVKLVLRPVRGGGMTSVTAIVAREDDRPAPLSMFGPAKGEGLRQALTRFRMWVEAGEEARAS